MNTRAIAATAFILISGLFGTGTATASALPTQDVISQDAQLHCGIHYKLTRDRNGRLYCKFSPDPRHRRGNGNNRHGNTNG